MIHLARDKGCDINSPDEGKDFVVEKQKEEEQEEKEKQKEKDDKSKSGSKSKSGDGEDDQPKKVDLRVPLNTGTLLAAVGRVHTFDCGIYWFRC